MWGPLKRKKDPQFPGNGGPKDPKLPKLVGTLRAADYGSSVRFLKTRKKC